MTRSVASSSQRQKRIGRKKKREMGREQGQEQKQERGREQGRRPPSTPSLCSFFPSPLSRSIG